MVEADEGSPAMEICRLKKEDSESNNADLDIREIWDMDRTFNPSQVDSRFYFYICEFRDMLLN